MWWTGFTALLSHWRRKPLQLLTLILGLALATALWSGVQAINSEARAGYAEAARALGEPHYDQLFPSDGSHIETKTYVALRRAGWRVSPVLEGRVTLAGNSYRVIGVEPVSVPRGIVPNGADVDGDIARFLTAPGIAYANPDEVNAVRAALTNLPSLELQPASGIAPGLIFTDIGVAQRVLGQSGPISRLIIDDDQRADLPAIESLAPRLERRAAQQNGDIARLTDSFHLNLTAFGLLSFAVGLFIVHGAIGLAFEQRRPMFRTLRALGLPLSVLVLLICLELLGFALFSGGLGMVMGYGIAGALLPDVAATLRGLYGAELTGTLTLRPAWWLAGMAIAILGTALASVAAILKVARLPLLASAHPRAWARASERRLIGLALVSIALIGIALLTAQFGSGLIAGFTMLGALLVAAALALPLTLHALLTLAQRRAKGVLAGWFWADTRQQLPGLSLALMALLLALAANIGVGTMVSSFRLTFTGWLDQRLASELYVTATSDAQATDLQAFLKPRSDAVLPIWNTKTRVLGQPAEIYGVADHATYRDNWPILDSLPNAWDRVADGSAVMVNEQIALRENLRPGALITLPGGQSLQVAGIYSDYGNPVAQILMSLPLLNAQFTQINKRQFAVRVTPDKVKALTLALQDDFGLPADSITDQASIKAFSLQVFERTFTVTGALNVLTLSVAGFAILTSLLTLATIRQPQLAPVWALGLTRAKLAQLEVLRALMLALLTVIAAVPVGLLLAWVLLNIINVAAFGWRLPMHLFPFEWLKLGVLSMVAAVLAAFWPALRLAKTPPAELLKVFANER